MKRLLIATLALMGIAGLATAGQYEMLPTVGGAARCGGYSTGVSGQVCSVTIPAGPTDLTGAETIPADTNLTQGRMPQNVSIPVKTLGGGAQQLETPLTGASVVVAGNTGTLLLQPAGTIATLTVTTPAASLLTNGQVLNITSTATVTALTLTAGFGTTILNIPTAITPSTTGSYGYQFVYRAANTTWYRTQ